MPLPAAIATLPALGKTLYGLGTAAAPYVPAIGAAGGALSQRDRGLGGMIQGGLIGGVSTLGLGGPLKKVMHPASRMAGGLAAASGLQGGGARVLTGATRAAIPLAAGLGVGGLSAGTLNAAVPGIQQAGGIGTGLAANQLAGGGPPNFTNQNMMSALPGGFNYNVNPYGGIYDVINPAGALQAGRLNRLYDYDTTVSGIHKIMPAMRVYSEQAKKDDMARQLAADQLRANINQAATMALNAQTAGLNQGTTAMSQVGQALTNQYRY